MHGKLFKSLICVLIIATFAFAAALTSGASDEPSMTIDYYNLSYSQYTFVMYAVHAEGIDTPEEIRMLFWASPQDEYLVNTETYSTAYYGHETIRGEGYEIFHSGGITPKKLIDTIYCRAYVNVGGEDYYSEVVKYSPLKYIKDLLASPTADEAGKNLASALRDYGAAAQIKFNWKTDDLLTDTHYFITAENALLDDGFSYGLYKEGTELTLTAVVPAGDSVARWANAAGATIGTGDTLTLSLTSDMSVRAILSSDPDSCEHEFAPWVDASDATCTEAGNVGYYQCTICGRYFDANYDVIDDAVIEALGHDWVDVDAVPATCVPGHTAYRYCARCNETEGYEEIPAAAEHDYVEQVVAPSGERRGYTDHVCSVCGDSYRTDYDYSLYSGVDFSTAGKYPIPQNFSSQAYTIEAAIQLPTTVTGRAGVIVGSYDSTNPAFNLEIYNGGKPRLFVMTVENGVTKKYDYVFNTDIRVVVPEVDTNADPAEAGEENPSGNEGVTAAPPVVKHLAITIEPGLAKLYVDGVLVETKELDEFVFPTVGRMLVLGGDNRTGNSQAFVGTIYSVSVFSDIRTEEEIASDLVWADENDQHCTFSINLLSSSSINQGVVLDNIQEYAQVTNAEELAYHASHGTRNIEVMNDITLDRSVFAIGDVTIYSNTDCTILRDPDFYSDMFVVGENSYGRNLLLDNISCVLNLGKDTATGTLTLDGNKANVTGDVYGSILFVNNSAHVNINGAVMTNNKKVGNSRALAMQQSYANYIGGAAIANINGHVVLNSGTISACEVNSTEISGGDSSAENYRQSMYGGAIYNCSNFTMNGGTISGTGEYAAYYGGAIVNRGRLEILGGVIENHAASHAGGAIYMVASYSASIIIGNENGNATDVIFRNNRTPSSGGVIYVSAYATILINGGATFDGNRAGASSSSGGAIYTSVSCHIGPNTVFSNNSAANGGAIYFDENDANPRSKTLTGVTFTGNTATKYGGAVYVFGAEVEFTDCVFSSNTAGTEGGAVHSAVYSKVTITDSQFTDNESSGNSGALTLRGTEATITGSTFTDNTASGNGGAIYAAYTTVTGENDESTQIPSVVVFTDNTFDGNTSSGNGGAICTATGTTLDVTDNTFENNTAKNGGGIYTTNTTVTGSGNTFDSNEAVPVYTEDPDTGVSSYDSGGCGGGATFSTSPATLTNSVFTGNTAYDGAGIYATGSTTTLTGVTATANAASHVGGFTYTKSNTLTISGTTVIGSATDSTLGNTSGNNGGALYGDTNASMILNGITVAGNTAGNAGGALYVRNHFEATDVEFIGNSANYGGALFIYNTNDAVLDGCTLTANQSTSSVGGAVYINAGSGASATLSAVDTTFSDNTSATTGGAVNINAGCEFDADGCTFSGNTAATYGGAIHVVSGSTLVAEDTTFTGNVATANGGGAISTYKSSANDNRATLTLTNVTLDQNTAANGGALYLSETDATLSGIVTDNSTTGSGGIGYINLGTELTIDEITATGNNAGSYGGGFYVNRSTLNIENDEEEKIIFGALESADPENPVTAEDLETLKNYSSGSGGVIYGTVGANINAKNAIFANNTAYSYGGAIFANPASGIATLTTENCSFIGNKATRTNSSTNYGGGAIAVMSTGAWADYGSTFDGNSGSYGGALIAGETASIALNGTSFIGNESFRYAGGAIQMQDSAVVTISDALFSGNTAYTVGGAINNVSLGALTVTDTDFVGNTSGSHGGAVRLYAAADADVSSFTGCSFTNNAATGTGNGGAFYIASATVSTLTDVTFNGNTALGGTDNSIYAAGTAQTTIDGITFTLPCGTPQINTSTRNVKLTIHSDKVFDQNANAVDITDGYIGGAATVTYVTGD